MSSLLRNTALVSTALVLGACASLFDGTGQNVEVITYGVDGASCELTDDKDRRFSLASTPGTVRLQRGDGPVLVSCSKPGFETAEGRIFQSFNPWTIGSLFLGLVPIGVDLYTGAYQDYDDRIGLDMKPIDGATQTSALAPTQPLAASSEPLLPPAGGTLSEAESTAPPPAPALLPGPSESAPAPISGNLTRAEMMLQEAQATLNTPPPAVSPTQPAAIQPAAVPATVSQPITASGRYAVQVGAFGNRNNATRLVQRIENAGMPTFTRPQRSLTAVRLGPYASRSEASAAARSYRQTFGGQAVIVRN